MGAEPSSESIPRVGEQRLMLLRNVASRQLVGRAPLVVSVNECGIVEHRWRSVYELDQYLRHTAATLGVASSSRLMAK
jgi:hypothetical protein